ncbi:MAG: RNA polymerase sigma factor [Candidatus Dormibacter sp.]|uniref:RNA polymerase sigma factor n=1 Tax=Candidatus Dormibacter sp. TaxID=2973982 RepID=UPI000DB5FD9F|nr:MAG: hypothetical protein DLM66_05965 [Candidatus Dormibacteraeota bacterium]
MAEVAGSLDFDDLYQRYRLPIYRSIRGIVLDGAAAEDLTQETFERAFKAQSESITAAGAWLHRIGINLALSHLRRQKLARLLPVKLFTREEVSDFDRSENRTAVSRALEALNPNQRAVVVLTYYSDLTREEVSQSLGIPPGTVASRLTAALRIMRGVIGKTETAPEASLASGPDNG